MKYYTPGQIAKKEEVHVNTVRHWCNRGFLKFTLNSKGERRISDKDYKAFKQQGGRRRRMVFDNDYVKAPINTNAELEVLEATKAISASRKMANTIRALWARIDALNKELSECRKKLTRLQMTK